MDTNDQGITSSHPPETMGELSFPFTRDQFSDFLKSLLGESQTIERNFYKPFLVTPLNIKAIHDALLIRIGQQNAGRLIAFNGRVLFKDGSSVALTSPESFFTYGEVKPVESSAVIVKWSFLVQFADKNVPEKQEVTLSASGSTYERTFMHEAIQHRMLNYRDMPDIGIHLRIEHTARTWGADIENLLANQIGHLVNEPSWWSKFLQRYDDRLCIFAACIIIIGAIVSSIIAIRLYATQLIARAEYISTSPVEERIDFVIDLVAKGYWPQFTFICLMYVLVCSVLAIIASVILIDNLAISRTPSFVVMSDYTQKKMEELLAIRAKNERRFLMAFATEIVLGIASNIAFALLFERFI